MLDCRGCAARSCDTQANHMKQQGYSLSCSQCVQASPLPAAITSAVGCFSAVIAAAIAAVLLSAAFSSTQQGVATCLWYVRPAAAATAVTACMAAADSTDTDATDVDESSLEVDRAGSSLQYVLDTLARILPVLQNGSPPGVAPRAGGQQVPGNTQEAGHHSTP